MNIYNWNYFNPVNVYSNSSFINQLKHIKKHEKTLLLTTNTFKNNGTEASVAAIFGEKNIVLAEPIGANPELDKMDDLIDFFKSSSIERIVAIGGGSVIDAAKILSIGLPTSIRKPLNQFFRLKNNFVWADSLPVVAIPTTSGTGAEVTPFATIWDQHTKNKFSLYDPKIFPDTVILDPLLTLSAPKDIYLYSCLDALSHCLESLWNLNKSPISQIFSLAGLKLVIENFESANKSTPDILSRRNMQYASLMGGLAISNTKTAIAHSISYPLTLNFNVPHGLACSFSLKNIIDLYLQRNENIEFKEELIKAKNLLVKLNLNERLASYLNKVQLYALKDQMIDQSRAANFDCINFRDIDLARILD